MSLPLLIEALGLPAATRVDRRVPKKLLLEQAAATTGDKRSIQDGIDELHWVAALKPENIAVPVFKDELREYLEVSVLAVTLRSAAKLGALSKVIHRAIPYPVVLCLIQDGAVALSLAHKRRSLGQTGEVVTEDVRGTARFRPDQPSVPEAAFLESLALSSLPRSDLYSLYQGWLDRVTALEAATITGAFRLSPTVESGAARLDALAAYGRHHSDLVSLRAKAELETQINRRVELNLTIKRIEAELASVKKAL